MLVIAADESVMPQTREHFDICRLLGVKQGLIALTKIDLVEEEMLELVKSEAEELVTGSFLEGAAIVTVSARTGKGLDQLRATLLQIAGDIPERSKNYVMRLPVDRAFTMKGFGAVVTGTLVSGEIAEADELELLPSGRKVRVRGVQVHGEPVSRARSGQRTAVNLAGIDVADIERGMVIAESGRLRPTQIIDVQLAVLKEATRSIRTRARVRLHIGSAEVLARVRVLNSGGEIAPGESGFAQLRLETPVVALHDERFIVRSYSPAETIAGGIVLEPIAKKHRGKELATTDQYLRALMDPQPAKKLLAFVTASGESGLRAGDIAARTGWTDEALLEAKHGAGESGDLIETGEVFLSTHVFERLSRAATEAVAAHHLREPMSKGLPRETLRERHFAHTPPEVFRAVIQQLENDGALVSEKDLIRSSEHNLDLSPADAKLRESLALSYEKGALEAPSLAEAFSAAGVVATQQTHARKILQLLIDDGTIVRVHGDMFFHAAALGNLKKAMLQFAEENGPDRLIDVAQFKALANISRKYAIPLLEYFDRERVTRRAGDKRIILI